MKLRKQKANRPKRKSKALNFIGDVFECIFEFILDLIFDIFD